MFSKTFLKKQFSRTILKILDKSSLKINFQLCPMTNTPLSMIHISFHKYSQKKRNFFDESPKR